jgi:NAD(P) transhydrogenase subunit alpha
VTEEIVDGMEQDSVVVDLAAERGGNCALTRPDQIVVHKGVTILGPTNPAASIPFHASQMYSKNITTFLLHLLGKDGGTRATLELNPEDEITRETLLTQGGQVVHPRVKELLSVGAQNR